jgi:hypothetical protein
MTALISVFPAVARGCSRRRSLGVASLRRHVVARGRVCVHSLPLSPNEYLMKMPGPFYLFKRINEAGHILFIRNSCVHSLPPFP